MSDYAVLIPLVTTEEGLSLLFEVRSENVSQPGEVCFPGGRVEGGETAAQTAVRETCEELGVRPDQIELIGELPPEISRNSRNVFPVAARLRIGSTEDLRLSEEEVAEVFLIPESWLRGNPPARYDLGVLTDDQLPAGLRRFMPNYDRYSRKYSTDYYEYNGHGIWGLTARILTHYLNCGIHTGDQASPRLES